MKHVSFFPLLVLSLTLVLVTGYVFFSSPNSSSPKSGVGQIVLSVDDYEDALRTVLAQFRSTYDAAPDDAQKVARIEHAMNALLSMRVPNEQKELHLGLALALQKMKQGYGANPQDITDGYNEVNRLISETDWLRL